MSAGREAQRRRLQGQAQDRHRSSQEVSSSLFLAHLSLCAEMHSWKTRRTFSQGLAHVGIPETEAPEAVRRGSPGLGGAKSPCPYWRGPRGHVLWLPGAGGMARGQRSGLCRLRKGLPGSLPGSCACLSCHPGMPFLSPRPSAAPRPLIQPPTSFLPNADLF